MAFLLLFALLCLVASTLAQNATLYFGSTGVYDLRACVDPKTVALTYDDGPSPYSLELLSILRAKNVTATFFVVGTSIQYFGASMAEAYRAGHLIGSHTLDHLSLPTLNDSGIMDQLVRNEQLIVSRIGVAPVALRPPFGEVDKRTGDLIRNFGQKIVVWSYDSFDSKNASNVTQAILDRAKTELPDAANAFEGQIILLHETKLESVRATSSLIDIVRSKGYRFVTLAECMGAAPGTPQYKPRSSTPPAAPSPSGSTASSTSSTATPNSSTPSPPSGSRASSGRQTAVQGLLWVIAGGAGWMMA
ncbi:hypothetical protein DFJ74DRAFT_265981 [Hyaloraphidium curvatum]|nr:hypothetical protein DFJ74DRAFT_265981 [Hyaloraphidium curvatum]